MLSVQAQALSTKEEVPHSLLRSVVAPTASQWPESWLDEFPLLRAFALTDLDSMVRVLRASDDELVYPICHTRHPTLGFLASDPAQIANHAYWAAQIIIALDAWSICSPSLWSRQISEDGLRTYRPLLYGPLNHIRKLGGRLETPLGDLDPRLHPQAFRELCLSLREQWTVEWPNSYRISGALSFLAVGRRGARRVRHYTDFQLRQSTQDADRNRETPPPGIKSRDPGSYGGASRLSVNTRMIDPHPIVECDAQDRYEHDARDAESVAVLRSRHRALRLDRSCLRATLNQPASDTLDLLTQLLTFPEGSPCDPQSRLLSGLALFSGRPFLEVAQIPVLSPRTFQTGLVETDRWFLRLVLPHPRPDGTASYVDHELPALMQGLLTDLTIAPGGTLATPEEAEAARDAIGTLLSPYMSDVNLIHRVIIGEVRTLTGAGDGGVEAVLGLNVGHDTQAHYTVIELDRAKQIYRAACAKLIGRTVEEVFQPEGSGHNSRIPPTQFSQFLISRTPVPGQTQLRKFFEAEFTSFRKMFAPSAGRNEQAESSVFNGAVSLVAFLQSLLTANRPTHGVYIPRHLINERTGLIAHGDKTDEAGYERRLLYFPPELLLIMKRFEAATDQWCRSHDLVPYSEVSCLIRADGRAVELTAHVIESHWGSRFPFPANTLRRLHFAWLCMRGTPTLFRNMAMGHWTGGNEPWGQCSSLYIGEYLEWRRRTVTEILPDLGLPDLASMEQMCGRPSLQVGDEWHSSPGRYENAPDSQYGKSV